MRQECEARGRGHEGAISARERRQSPRVALRVGWAGAGVSLRMAARVSRWVNRSAAACPAPLNLRPSLTVPLLLALAGLPLLLAAIAPPPCSR
jgi:hypothetical protein